LENALNRKSQISRREFIAGAAGAAALFAPSAIASPLVLPEVRRCLNLTIIHLSGGNDGINTLVPYSSREYYKNRPTIALHGDELLKVSGEYAFNSAVKEVAELFRSGLVAAFPNTGCRDGLTMSHERASEIWRTAKPSSIECDDWFAPARKHVSLITLDGFDTHSEQKTQHQAALRRLSVLIDKIVRDCSEDDLILVYSEFGRSLLENEMAGTDHGGNGLMLAIGQGVAGGIYDGEIDFRQMYKTLAQKFQTSSRFKSAELFPALSSFSSLNFC
jgi:uncharacterized protein (DUF1501 family)